MAAFLCSAAPFRAHSLLNRLVRVAVTLMEPASRAKMSASDLTPCQQLTVVAEARVAQAALLLSLQPPFWQRRWNQGNSKATSTTPYSQRLGNGTKR